MSEPELLPTLPDDVITDILSWLPVRSLVRFRCVNKTWNRLIRDQKFTDLHLKQSRQNDVDGSCSGHRVLISVNPCEILVCEKLRDGIEHEIVKDDVVLKVDSPVEFKFPDIIGSCDGMLCMMSGEIFYLWNPSMRECREIRESDMRYKLDEYSIFGYCRLLGRMFGFGYDSLTDDYKIVSINWNLNEGKMDAVIIAVGSNKWRRVTDSIPRCHVILPMVMSFTNGAIHWLVLLSETAEVQIASFDLGKERIGKLMRLPPVLVADNRYDFALRVFEGKLAVVASDYKYDTQPTIIWIMELYGVESSWIRKFTFPDLQGRQQCRGLIPLCLGSNGMVPVVVNRRDLMVCDLERKTYKELGVRGRAGWNWETCYSESLISPYRIPNPNQRSVRIASQTQIATLGLGPAFSSVSSGSQ